MQNTEKSFNSHIDKLSLANQDYFDHLAGYFSNLLANFKENAFAQCTQLFESSLLNILFLFSCICGFHRCNAR